MPTKSLLFAIDSGDPTFINAMIDDGELPNLRLLREENSTLKIENDPGMGAQQFWTCLAVGGGPDNHGQYFYMQFKPDSYDIIPNHESSLPDITAFWETLDVEGYKIAVLDWHRMLVAPMAKGMLIDNWLGHDPLTGVKTWPPQLKDSLKEYYSGDSNAGGFEAKNYNTAHELNIYIDNLLNRIEAKTKFCIDQITNHDWNLFVTSFSEAHDLGHHLLHLEDRTHERYNPALAATVPHPLRRSYQKIDWALGQLMQAVDDKTEISVLAGPGMEASLSPNRAIDEIVRSIDLGAGKPPSSEESVRSTYSSVVPIKIRRMLSPYARLFRRKLLNSQYLNRRFFAVPNNDNAAAIRINLKGREHHGIVSPGAEYEAVIAEIRDAFSTFINPDTGNALVKRIICIPHDYSGPYVDVLPDVFVEWNRHETTRSFRKVISSRYGEFDIPPTERSGDHNMDGFYWSATPAQPTAHTPARPGDVTDLIIQSVRRHPPVS